MRAVLAVLAAALAASAAAQDAPGPVRDPLNAETFAAAYGWRGTVWSAGRARSDYWGGRFQAQVGFGHVGVAGRIDVAGLPAQFDVNEPGTFNSAEVMLAAHVNLKSNPAGFVVGPALIAGKAVSIDLAQAPTPGQFTAAGGVRIAGWNGAVYILVGTHQALGGLCSVVGVHAPITTRLFFMGDAALGPTRHSPNWFAKLNVGVVLAQ